MKLIRQSKLFFIEGKSDKVYEIDLCELSSNEYLVNFRYGRRGSSLKEGTKTPEAVSLEKAESLFNALESEKRKKGYQSEAETFVEMPPMETVNPASAEGAILQRLQDAVADTNSFKTEWKITRVIRAAGKRNIQAAIPFIMRLCKGDQLQVYSALMALYELKAVQADALFKSYAGNQRQKSYIRNLCIEALLALSAEDEKAKLIAELLERMPVEIQQDIQSNNYESLEAQLTEHSKRGFVSYFSDLYLLCNVRKDLLGAVRGAFDTWTFRPPYFKQIRAIYKLAQIRKDYPTLALLSYRFEKESAMFNNSNSSYYEDYGRYVEAIGDYINVTNELKKKDSRLAFSNVTKKYFQRNTAGFLKETGQNAAAKDYLQLAVGILLQYKPADYSPAGEHPLFEYGEYNYQDKLYYYTLYNYPECYNSFLLTNILFGNDKNRKIRANLQYYIGKRTVVSSSYWYQPDKVREITNSASSRAQAGNAEKQSVLGRIKNIFDKKQNEMPPDLPAPPPIPGSEANAAPSGKRRFELFPEHWDAMPQAYVQLLMQAQLDVIHTFAYDNLKKHADYPAICNRFDKEALLILLSSRFATPNQLGFEVLEQRKEEFKNDVAFIARILSSNGPDARKWAREIIGENPSLYLDSLDFVVSIMADVWEDNKLFISGLLLEGKANFTEERLQAITGKLVMALLQFENNEKNNEAATMIVGRLNSLAQAQMEKISWDIVEQLILSPLMMNIWLASSITLQKIQHIDSSGVPTSLTGLFLQSEVAEVRQNGLQLLNAYPLSFIEQNFDFVLNLVSNPYQEVVENVLRLIQNIIKDNGSLAAKTVQHFVYALIRKERFEGAHLLINKFVSQDLKPYWEKGLTPKDITKLIHAQYRQSQLTGYEILKSYSTPDSFSLGQIISFGSHEILAVRQWCWNYYKNNVTRIRTEKDKSLNILDAKWDDTRAYAFHFFKTEFSENDWDTDTIIGIVDSIRPDVEAFGKELITMHFKPEHAMEYLTKLSEHPSVNVQAFVTNYLSVYAGGNAGVIKELDYYFRSVLTRVNKTRVAKNRIYRFLQEEACRNEEIAMIVTPILDDVSAQSTVQDKATCIHILSEIKSLYPQLDMHLAIRE